MIKAIIIDDEPWAIDVLTILLKKKCSQDVQVVATSNSPKLGKALIEEHQPDLVFLRWIPYQLHYNFPMQIE
jgi:YesN/AraC family two-component response regulator